MKDSQTFICFCWLFQILSWVCLIWMIVSYIIDASNKYISLILFIICYIVYIILEFCSSTAKYICHKTTEEGIYQKMGQYYRTYPVFKFYCECFHYETRRRKVRTKSKGKTRTRTVTERVRVTTHRETYIFPYYSERDVSGLFYLDCDRAYLQRKCYIQLDLFSEINFADAISYMDYQVQKDLFWRRNRFRDKRFYFDESRYIPGLIQENLIRLSDSEPCCINFFFYFILTLLTFAEFFKLYFNSLCISQTYRIRKLVSTRYDLNQDIYQDFIPQIDIISQQYNFQVNDYNYMNNDYHLKVPTQEELNRAAKYQNKVPDYKISSGGGKIHAGVVLDDPGYSSYNLNKPPEAFTSIAGDVALGKNQVNANGAPPPGFGQSDFRFNINQNDDDDSDDDNQHNKPNQGYASNNIAQTNNTAYQGNNQSNQVKTYTEREHLKNNQQYPPQQFNNNNQYNQYPQNYPPQQQYPPQYPQPQYGYYPQ